MSIPNVVEFAAVEDESEQPSRKHLRERLLSLDDLASLPPAVPLVDGLLYRGTLAQLAGQPGSYKSFLTVGMACSVALGRDWEGHRVPAAGPVVYVAPEGASGLRARVLAWCDLSSIDPAELRDRLLFLPAPIQLGYSVDVTEAVEVACEIEAALLVLDARALHPRPRGEQRHRPGAGHRRRRTHPTGQRRGRARRPPLRPRRRPRPRQQRMGRRRVVRPAADRRRPQGEDQVREAQGHSRRLRAPLPAASAHRARTAHAPTAPSSSAPRS